MNDIRSTVDGIYRSESRRVFATLVRLLGELDLAEEAMHEAFAAAMEQWPETGVPSNPRAWLVSTGRFKGIDVIRRRTRFDASLEGVAHRLEARASERRNEDDEAVADDRLRLIFMCCHPALSVEAQIALTLREVCGLTTEEIASAFLVAPATLAQRIVRAKSKIRGAGIPYQIPSIADLPARLNVVLSVIYLVFNEGYSASSGESVTRPSLSEEAIRLGRLLVALLPDPEALGLLALMLLQESRRRARATEAGDLVLLEQQDRALWDRAQVQEGKSFLQRAIETRHFGMYTVQAAIAAVHADATSAAETDWAQIVELYDLLFQIEPSPVIALNRAVAVAMRDGPEAGLRLIEGLLAQGDLGGYHLAYAAQADLHRRLGNTAAARDAYQRALVLVQQEPERRFLQKRLHELQEMTGSA